MRTLSLALFLTLGCTSDGDTDTDSDTTSDVDTSDVDTSDDTDTSADTDTDSDADTEPEVDCVFSELAVRSDSTVPPQPFVSFSTETTLDACFGSELEGRFVREAYNGSGNLCRMVFPFTAAVSVADADLCDTCDDAFDEIVWGTVTTTGSYCDELRMSPEPPLFCDGQTPVQIYAIATGTEPDALYRPSVADGFEWRAWLSTDGAIRGEDPAAGVSVVQSGSGSFDPEAESFPPCQIQSGAGR